MARVKKKAGIKATSYEAHMQERPGTVLFHFQPDKVAVADTPAKLKRWEKLMREKVGLPPLGVEDDGAATITFCESNVGPYNCDCDYDRTQESERD